jgi:hypothetical protein
MKTDPLQKKNGDFEKPMMILMKQLNEQVYSLADFFDSIRQSQ